MYRGADGTVRSLTAEEGVEQGDAFAPALFAYGLRPALVRTQAELDQFCSDSNLPRIVLMAYLDDIVIVAPTCGAEAAFRILQTALQDECGLCLSESKTQIWSPTQVCPPGDLAQYWRPDGIVVLGGPLGELSLTTALRHDQLRAQAVPYGNQSGPFVSAFLEARLDAMRKAAETVLVLPSKAPHDYPALQIALQLLVFCVAPKADHLLRHLPPAASATLASNIDQLILETFQRMFEVRLSTAQAEQVSFSLAEGGLGLRARGRGCELGAFLGSWALVYHKITATLGWRFSGDHAPLGSTFARVREAAEAAVAAGAPSAAQLLDVTWWDAASAEPVPRLQASLARPIRARCREAWLARASPKGRARLHTHSGWGAAVALHRCPTELALRLPDDAVRVAVCERLGLPLCKPGRCGLRFASGRRCRYNTRLGAHAHCCSGTIGARTRFRHNPLVCEFNRFLTQAGRCTAVEQRDPCGASCASRYRGVSKRRRRPSCV